MPPTLLLSWIAHNTDFIFDREGPGARPQQVSPTGPNYNLHSHYFDPQRHRQHLLLVDDAGKPATQERLRLLEAALQRSFPGHGLEVRSVGVQDPTEVNELVLRLQQLLDELWAEGQEAMEAFISPGTPSMQVTWYLLYFMNRYPLTLVRGQEARFSPSDQPDFQPVELQQAVLPTLLYRTHLRADQQQDEEGGYMPPTLKPVYTAAEQIAQLPAAQLAHFPCLVYGASGTGKERLAHFLHQRSGRSGQKFIAVNCAAFRDELLESRLFGYKQGAFTGATKDRKGYFKQADGGVLMLDEIGEISPYMQQALLRVLQEGEIQPVGGLEPEQVDVWVIGATNKDLFEECRAGRFRWDLYYRLAVAELQLPALAEWTAEERMALLDHLNQAVARQLGHEPLVFAQAARARLQDYSFPGNIREMENLLKHLHITCATRAGAVAPEDLPPRLTQNLAEEQAALTLREAIHAHVRHVYALMGHNKSAAARALDISPNTLKKYL